MVGILSLLLNLYGLLAHNLQGSFRAIWTNIQLIYFPWKVKSMIYIKYLLLKESIKMTEKETWCRSYYLLFQLFKKSLKQCKAGDKNAKAEMGISVIQFVRMTTYEVQKNGFYQQFKRYSPIYVHRFAVFYFALQIPWFLDGRLMWKISPYSSGLLHWQGCPCVRELTLNDMGKINRHHIRAK